MPLPILVLVAIALPITIGFAVHSSLAAAITFVTVLIANPILWQVRKSRYFASAQFQVLRAEVAALVAEHNEIVSYVAGIRAQGSFNLGASSTGQYAHLATFENTSAWDNRRDRNVAEYAPPRSQRITPGCAQCEYATDQVSYEILLNQSRSGDPGQCPTGGWVHFPAGGCRRQRTGA